MDDIRYIKATNTLIMARRQDFEVFIGKYDPHMENNDIKQYDYWENKEHIELANEAGKSNKLWTCVQGDNGKLYLSPGKHLVNRLFYVICNKPYTNYNDTRDYKY